MFLAIDSLDLLSSISGFSFALSFEDGVKDASVPGQMQIFSAFKRGAHAWRTCVLFGILIKMSDLT